MYYTESIAWKSGRSHLCVMEVCFDKYDKRWEIIGPTIFWILWKVLRDSFYFKARNIMKGDPFTLICSVMVDFSTIVDLTWSTPNPRAIADHRLSQPDTVHRNLSWPGTHLKLVEQVINILHFGIGILCSRHQHGRHAPFEIGVTAELMTLFWAFLLFR